MIPVQATARNVTNTPRSVILDMDIRTQKRAAARLHQATGE